MKNRVGKFVTSPWKIEATGLVSKPQTLDLDELLKSMPLEERLYRFRCVEAWSMAVPWTGFPTSPDTSIVHGEVTNLPTRSFTASLSEGWNS